MSPERSTDLRSLAEKLLHARVAAALSSVEDPLIPRDLEEAYFVQDQIAAQVGSIGGWKIGASSPDAEPFFAPMPLAWMLPSGATVPKGRSRLRGVEVEVGFLLRQDLPVRSKPYERSEILDAIESVHVVIEIVESGLQDPTTISSLLKFADLQVNGGFVYGPAFADWQTIDWSGESACLRVNGKLSVERKGSNSAGTDLLRMLVYLANEGSARTGGLRQGQWITTGSWTGLVFCRSGDVVEGSYTHSNPVSLRFE